MEIDFPTSRGSFRRHETDDEKSDLHSMYSVDSDGFMGWGGKASASSVASGEERARTNAATLFTPTGRGNTASGSLTIGENDSALTAFF